MTGPVSWEGFARQRPDLAEAGRELLYQHGVGLAFLATTGRDDAPRLHPICPLLADGALVAFIVPSPKQRDLRRNGRFALHSFPLPDNEDAFCVTGRATLSDDAGRRAAAGHQFVAERARLGAAFPADADTLFEFAIGGCLLTRTTGHGDPEPRHVVWRAGRV